MATAEKIIETYEIYKSIRATAQKTGLSCQTVKRILISNGVCPSDRAVEAAKLAADGMSVAQIAEHMGISQKGVLANLPYIRSGYVTNAPSANAKRIRSWRERKKEEKHAEIKQC